MPDIAQQDIAYQPAAKAYSFSANQAVPPPAPQPKPEPALEPEQKPKMPRKPINWKPFFILSGEIAGLIAVFIVFLLILNFFNIISLSKIYPNQFGFLPHLTQATIDKTGYSPIIQQIENKPPQIATGTYKTISDNSITITTTDNKDMNFYMNNPAVIKELKKPMTAPNYSESDVFIKTLSRNELLTLLASQAGTLQIVYKQNGSTLQTLEIYYAPGI